MDYKIDHMLDYMLDYIIINLAIAELKRFVHCADKIKNFKDS